MKICSAHIIPVKFSPFTMKVIFETEEDLNNFRRFLFDDKHPGYKPNMWLEDLRYQFKKLLQKLNLEVH